jgi:hypothetical protein
MGRAELGSFLGIGEGLEDLMLASDAYVYSYPLVTMEMTRRVLTNVPQLEAMRGPRGGGSRRRLANGGLKRIERSCQSKINDSENEVRHVSRNLAANTDEPILAQRKKIGIEPGKSFDIGKLDPILHERSKPHRRTRKN